MEREFVYIDMEDGSKAIKVGKDNLPTYLETVEENGEKKQVERTVDAFHLLGKVPELSIDLKKYKEEARSMKEFTSAIKEKGILSDDDFSSGKVNEKFNEWLSSALTAQEKVKTFNDKDVEKIKKLDEMKAQIERARDEKLNQQKDFYDSQLKEKEDVVGRQRNQINKLMINDKFASSKFIKENCDHIPVSVIANTFSDKFKLKEEDGNWSVVGYKSDGNEIYSTSRALEVASFDEAIEVMMKEHSDKDYFFGGVVGNGSGNGAGKNSSSSLQSELERAMKNGDTLEQIRLKREIKKKQFNK